MDATLRIRGPGGTRTVPLPPDGAALSVGRRETSNVELQDPEKVVSRDHMTVRLRGRTLVVDVLPVAKRGVMLASGLLKPGQTGVLHPGDTLKVGAFELCFEAMDVDASLSPASWDPAGHPASGQRGADDPTNLDLPAPTSARDVDIINSILAEAPTPAPRGPASSDRLARDTRERDKWGVPVDGENSGAAIPTPPRAAGPRPPPAAPKPVAPQEAELDWGLTPSAPAAPIPAARAAPAPEPEPEPAPRPHAPPVSEPATRSTSAVGAVQALCRGLGIAVPVDATAADWERFGATFRDLLAGMQMLLKVRKLIRSDLGIEDMTEYVDVNNNILKSDRSLKELIGLLIHAPMESQTFMPASDSINQAVRDLQVHDHAIVAAIRAGLGGALLDLSPAGIRAKFKGAKLPANAEAKSSPFWERAALWSAYCEWHKQESAQLADWSNKMLNRHFVPEYSLATERNRSKS